MRWARYALVIGLAVELAVWEAFLVSARPFGVPLPVSAVLALAGTLALARLGAQELRSRRGAFGPALAWLVVAVTFSLPGPSGDAVIPGTGRGVLFLVVGMVTAVAVPMGLAGGRTKQAIRAPRATPGADFGR